MAKESAAEIKARLTEIDRETKRVLNSAFYRQHPVLRKQMLSHLNQRRQELRANPAQAFYGAISDYIQRLRNKEKKRYAVAYWQFLKGATAIEPNRGSLTAMGAQSVRIELARLARETEDKLTTKRNGIFDAASTVKAKRVIKTPPQVVETHTGQRGEIVEVLPDGWLKVKWRNRQRATLIKRSELKRATNPTLMQCFKTEQSLKRKLEANSRRCQEHVENPACQCAKNPGLIELAGGLQAADYLLGKLKSARRGNPTRKREKSELQLTTEVARDGRYRLHQEYFDSQGYYQAQHTQDFDFDSERERDRYVDDLKQKLKGIKVTVNAAFRSRRNPSTREMSERFQGESTGAVREYYVSEHAPRLNFSRAGKLVFLKVNGKQIRIPGAVAAIDPKSERLWIAGANKRPMFNRKAKTKGSALDFGEVDAICYMTAKRHIGNGKRFEYVHAFGEEGGRKPHLLVDYEGMPILKGGDYKVEDRGIID